MANPDVTPRTVLMLRVPLMSSSVHYRAYAEPLRGGSTLDWALSRFLGCIPPYVSIACVAESDFELGRLSAAYSNAANVSFVRVAGRGEIDHCRCLMDAQQVGRLFVARLSHAVIPLSIVRDVLTYHDTLRADLTEVAIPGSTASPFVVESSLINTLRETSLPNVPPDVLSAAALLRNARARDKRLAPAFSWSRVNASQLCKIGPAEWPESLGLESSTDLETLRGALDLVDDRLVNQSLVTAWKQASISAQRCGSRPVRLLGTGELSVRSASRLRVLYVCGVSSFVGAAQSLCHLIDGLDLRRYEPIAFVSFAGTFTDELRRRGVTVLCPNADTNPSTLDNVRLAHRVVRDISPDLVHGNHEIGLPLLGVLLGAQVPLVQHVRVQTAEGLAAEIHAADAVIAISQFVRQRIARLDVDLSKVEVILNGVNETHFQPAPLSKLSARDRIRMPRDEFIIAVIARLVPYKRHDVVIKAVSILRQMTGRGHLLLVGGLESNREYGTQIWKWIEQAGLACHTTHVEFTSDVPTLLHACDALALMSKDEALGRVVLEAMAVGLPVVVGDTGGPREVIEHGRNGFVVPHGNSEAVAGILRELALHPALATAVGTAAVETIRASLTSRHSAERVMRLYERVLSDRWSSSGVSAC